MITKPRFVTIDTDNFNNGQMPVWDAANHKFINSSDSAAINIKGDWADATDYVKNDVVYADGSSYVCILAHTSASTNEPGVGVDTDTYWQLLAKAGEDGATGATGAAGADGADGAPGADGQGVPAGGTTGQVLAKIDATDYNTEWVDPAGGGSGVFSEIASQAEAEAGTDNTKGMTPLRTAQAIAALESGAPTFIAPRVATAASSATPTPDADTTDQFILTAQAENMTFGAPTGTPSNRQKLIIEIDNTGAAYTIAWNAAYESKLATLPTTTTASKKLMIGLMYNSTASKWFCVVVVEEA